MRTGLDLFEKLSYEMIDFLIFYALIDFEQLHKGVSF